MTLSSSSVSVSDYAESIAVNPNTPDAMQFFDWWAPEGPWVLTAISPDKKSIETRVIEAARRDSMQAWIKSKNGLANLYFMVNPSIRLENKKASFPQLIRIGAKSVAWLEEELLLWVQRQTAERDNPAGHRTAGLQ